MDPLSLLTLMESNFDSNFTPLSRGVLPTVKYSGDLPVSTSMISRVVSGKKHIQFRQPGILTSVNRAHGDTLLAKAASDMS